MQVPVLAIIIPCYNEQEALGNTLDTLLGYMDWFLIKRSVKKVSFI